MMEEDRKFSQGKEGTQIIQNYTLEKKDTMQIKGTGTRRKVKMI